MQVDASRVIARLQNELAATITRAVIAEERAAAADERADRAEQALRDLAAQEPEATR